MDPADARNILGNEIKKWTGGSAGLEGCSGEILRDLQGNGPQSTDTEKLAINPPQPADSDDNFDLPGQAKTLPDETTLWKVNIIISIRLSIIHIFICSKAL